MENLSAMETTRSIENRGLARDLLALVARLRERLVEDPFANPILSAALTISRRMDRGQLTLPALAGLVAHLRDAAFADRAARLAHYDAGTAGMAETIARLVRPDPADSPVPFQEFAGAVARPRLAAVFTAHPTFALAPAAAAALAAGDPPPPGSQRPIGQPATAPQLGGAPTGGAPLGGITLAGEFAQAMAAIANGRDALDTLNRAILTAARATWPGRWQSLAPAPVLLASWVGFDTDGRTDIGFLDMLRFRLAMKQAALARLHAVTGIGAAALAAVERQLAAVPDHPAPDAVAAFAHVLVGGATTTAPLLAELDTRIAAAADPTDLLVARAGLAAHGLGLAHIHARLNAAQVHNAIRQRLGLADPPSDPARRRVLLAGINAALDQVEPVPVDFGAILAEQASAPRLMMTLAQILKHIDSETPIRFLIAETETGYTLLAALWLARHFGIERQVEICPLFETAASLEGGARIVEEALRSPAWRDYLCAQGRIALQFGYSDSGRYVGQPAASYLIERLKLKIAEALARHGLAGIELVLFDTHGESIGRGGHPASLAQRLDYLSPPAMRAALAERGIALRAESAFQGGDGYLHFATGERAGATIAGMFAHGFAPAAAAHAATDPIYDDPDFAADFFAASRTAMQELVEDRGYAALLGTFGPALLDRTGSRPAARQTDGMGGPAAIRHPRELRAIPNNAILQQVGWLANTAHGIGAAALRHAETFGEMRARSARFRTAMEMVAAALAVSDLDVLRAMVETLDPGMWFDRAAQARISGRREALISVARSLEALDLWAPAQAMFRRIQADHVALRAAWPEAPRMAERLALLHALRVALIQRIFILAAAIPDFSPRHGITRAGLAQRLLRLDVPASLAFLAEVFPASPDADADRDYGEPRARPEAGNYASEHATLFRPMGALFDLLREITVAVIHETGAFG